MAEAKKNVAKPVSSAAKRPASSKGVRKPAAKAKVAKPAVPKLTLKKSAGKTATVKTEVKKATTKNAPPPAKATPVKQTVTAAEPPMVTPETKPAAKAVSQPSATKPTTARPGGGKSHGKPFGSAHGKPLDSTRGKRYRELSRQVERDKLYPLAEAVQLAKRTSNTKFDATVELHVRLGIDARQAEQSVRGTVKLPAGTGKVLKVMAFVPTATQAAVKTAGADFVSDEATLQKIKDGWTGFDVAVATPDQMASVGKLGTVLGPKGLMPNPKSGTVSDDVAKVIGDVKAGSVEFRVAKDATVHAGIGKASFSEGDLEKNVSAYYRALVEAKPDGTKGTYIRSISLSSTMGPGIKVDTATIGVAKESV